VGGEGFELSRCSRGKSKVLRRVAYKVAYTATCWPQRSLTERAELEAGQRFFDQCRGAHRVKKTA
jgi:hypothetical protein